MPEEREWTRGEIEADFDDVKGVTVPVDIRVEARQKVLCLDEMKRLIGSTRTIAVTECKCRATMKKCDGPLDVCLFLNGPAEELVQEGAGRQISIDEALGILAECSGAGLVHLAIVSRETDAVEYVCSCCSCCCQCISGMQRLGFDDLLFSSAYVAVQDEGRCDDCGLCVDRCHFHARSIVDGRLVFDQAGCFGCGVCLSSCPVDAIRLIPRKTDA
jgi:ferredoxin